MAGGGGGGGGCGDLGAFLAGFQESPSSGLMVGPASRGGAFDPACVAVETVIALDHGLHKAQESGLFAPGELLVMAVSTKDMRVCYAGGTALQVLGAGAEVGLGPRAHCIHRLPHFSILVFH